MELNHDQTISKSKVESVSEVKREQKMLRRIFAIETGDFSKFTDTVRGKNWVCRNHTFSLRTISFWGKRYEIGSPETLSEPFSKL